MAHHHLLLPGASTMALAASGLVDIPRLAGADVNGLGAGAALAAVVLVALDVEFPDEEGVIVLTLALVLVLGLKVCATGVMAISALNVAG